eukprot:Gb_17002 [translate_table: standard]
MAKYYLRFDTMKGIMKTPNKCSLEDLLYIIAQSEEIAWIQLRRNEKKLLNAINSDKNGRLRFHILDTNGKIKKRIQTREEKIFVLANDSLCGDPLVHDLTLNQDVNAICSNGSRIARCMRECFIFQKRYKEAINSMVLAKCLHQRLWDDSPYQLKQLVGVGMVTAKALHLSGINSFEHLEKADPRRLEIITGRKYPFGNHIKESMLSLPPKVDIKIEEMDHKRQGKIKLLVTLTRISTSSPPTKRHFADLVVGSEEDNLILFQERISPYTVTVYTSNVQDKPINIKVDVVSEEYVGVDFHSKFVSSKQGSAKQQKCKAVEDLCAIQIQSPIRILTPWKKEEKLNLSPSSTNACSIDAEILGVCSMPTFTLLPEDENTNEEGFGILEEHAAEAPTISISKDKRYKKESIPGEKIFEHIRRKARNLPSFETCLGFTSSKHHGVPMLLPQNSKKNRRLERENQFHSELIPDMKRTKQDETFRGSVDISNLQARRTSKNHVSVCDGGMTKDFRFEEATITDNVMTRTFSTYGHEIADIELMDMPHSLNSAKTSAHLGMNFPVDSCSVITIEDSQSSRSSAAEDDTEISVNIESIYSLDSSESKHNICGDALLKFSSTQELNSERSELECESAKLDGKNNKNIDFSTTTSSSNPMVTSQDKHTHETMQQQCFVGNDCHRSYGTSSESQDHSISFMAEEIEESSFLACQSVFSFL